jgi:hypothetical protein
MGIGSVKGLPQVGGMVPRSMAGFRNWASLRNSASLRILTSTPVRLFFPLFHKNKGIAVLEAAWDCGTMQGKESFPEILARFLCETSAISFVVSKTAFSFTIVVEKFLSLLSMASLIPFPIVSNPSN